MLFGFQLVTTTITNFIYCGFSYKLNVVSSQSTKPSSPLSSQNRGSGVKTATFSNEPTAGATTSAEPSTATSSGGAQPISSSSSLSESDRIALGVGLGVELGVGLPTVDISMLA